MYHTELQKKIIQMWAHEHGNVKKEVLLTVRIEPFFFFFSGVGYSFQSSHLLPKDDNPLEKEEEERDMMNKKICLVWLPKSSVHPYYIFGLLICLWSEQAVLLETCSVMMDHVVLSSLGSGSV
jgi:hypothetical protein